MQDLARRKLGLQVESDFKVRTRPLISQNDIWVRKTLIHQWVLLMVGLEWYLDVFGSESQIVLFGY